MNEDNRPIKVETDNENKRTRSFNWKKHLKKDLIVLSSALLIGGAVYLNWSFFSGGTAQAGSKGEKKEETKIAQTEANAEKADDDYFTETIITRQRARDESMEVLSLIIDDENAVEEAKSEAMTNLNEIASDIEAEANIETLVLSKGFEDCVAVIADGSASVIVKSDGLLENEITQIQEIVYEQSGIEPVNLKIIQK